ncbi:MAG: GxxExxY protein [Lysobacteraceae bacterium]|nr:MAG: GxxExxY protein [Xanthomonadaceae bacterium]
MDGEEGRLIEGRLTQQVIGGFYAVYNELGPGFLESVYVNAMVIALGELGLKAAREVPLEVRFRSKVVGQFRADLLVEGRLILEVKAVSHLAIPHEVQLVNYLRATGIQVGLLLNFGPRAELRRRVLQTDD